MRQQELAPRLGRAAEHVVAAWLLRNNDVWVSAMPDAASVDLVVVPRARPDKRYSIQVKMVFDAKSKAGQHRTVNVSKASGIRYNPSEVDFLVAVDIESLTFWMIPVRALKNLGRVRLGKKYSGYALGWHDTCPVFGMRSERAK